MSLWSLACLLLRCCSVIRTYHHNLLVTLKLTSRYIHWPTRQNIYVAGKYHKYFTTTLDRHVKNVCFLLLQKYDWWLNNSAIVFSFCRSQEEWTKFFTRCQAWQNIQALNLCDLNIYILCKMHWMCSELTMAVWDSGDGKVRPISHSCYVLCK